MKKFLWKVFLFLLIFVMIDQIAGVFFQMVSDSIHIGGTGRDNYICNAVKDDILIFGSSRAESHYNAQLITDSLGVTAYNCGESGNGVILNYGRLLMILERHTPKCIIYDVMPDFDYLMGEDNHKYLYRLKPHYYRKGIKGIFDDVDIKEKYKMLSGLYRFNSSFFQNLLVFITGISTDSGVRGFRPMKGELDPLKVADDGMNYDGFICDSLKINYIQEFINKTKASDVLFVVSPLWYGQDTSVFQPIKDLCKKNNIRFVDFSNDDKYVHNDSLFKNGQHLNAKGADVFSKEIVELLKGR